MRYVTLLFAVAPLDCGGRRLSSYAKRFFFFFPLSIYASFLGKPFFFILFLYRLFFASAILKTVKIPKLSCTALVHTNAFKRRDHETIRFAFVYDFYTLQLWMRFYGGFFFNCYEMTKWTKWKKKNTCFFIFAPRYLLSSIQNVFENHGVFNCENGIFPVWTAIISNGF